jgi:hypothetical protein
MLKSTKKASEQDHNELRAARKKARRAAEKAVHRAATAEARYDEAVLAEALTPRLDSAAHSSTTTRPRAESAG